MKKIYFSKLPLELASGTREVLAQLGLSENKKGTPVSVERAPFLHNRLGRYRTVCTDDALLELARTILCNLVKSGGKFRAVLLRPVLNGMECFVHQRFRIGTGVEVDFLGGRRVPAKRLTRPLADYEIVGGVLGGDRHFYWIDFLFAQSQCCFEITFFQ